MDVVLLILIALLLGVASTTLYLNLKSKQKKDENKEAEEITNLKSEISSLKDTLNSTINTSLGATEIYPFTGSSEIITDITSTGETLRAILKSQACLMISKKSVKIKGIKKVINLISK